MVHRSFSGAVRFVAALMALWSAAVAPSFAQATDVSGWWRADLAHADETQPFYLHFDQDGQGAPRARISIPVVRMHDAPVGGFAVSGAEVRLPGLDWRLAIVGDGAELRGVMPAALTPSYDMPARFTRSEAPPSPPAALEPRAPPPRARWSASVGAPVWAGPVVDIPRRLVYIAADDGRVHALAAHSGRVRWVTDLGAPIRATPTLAGGRLYVATDAALFALNPRDGSQIWSAPFGPARAPRLPLSDPNSTWDHYSASAAVDGPFIAVAARDGCVHALHTANGAERWRSCTEQGVLTGTPALTRDQVFFGGFDGAAYAVSRATGALRWRRDLGAAAPRDAVLSGGNVLFGARTYELHALNPYTGETDWTRYFWFSWVDSTPVEAGDVFYIGSSDALVVQAFVSQSGRRLWASPVPGWSWARPAVGRSAVYAGVVGGPYMAERTGGLAAIERRDGALRWLFQAPRPADSSALYGFAAAPAVAGHWVFAADLSGMVYAFPE
ncbi:MAG: PQQ-binding-like beta-propeller repeat protein [Hyphomonadaceae bacterium]|nr:PQQ-binding-like beta-propeller repeat protein [Hyphomonadaceae bacterium]